MTELAEISGTVNSHVERVLHELPKRHDHVP